MKSTILIVLLSWSGTTFAQLNSYYALGEKLYSSDVSTADQPYLTEFGNVSYKFASARLNSFLKNKFNFEQIQHSEKKINDSTFVFVERWKSIDNPEINPKTQFIEFKYAARRIAYDTVISNLECSGSEEYIGDLYKEFWNASLNLQAGNKDVLCVWEFKKDLVELHHKDKVEAGSPYSSYWLTVKSTEENQKAFDTRLAETLMHRKHETDELKKLRETKVYHFEEIDSSYYLVKRNIIASKIKTILWEENNLTGDLKVIVRVDTLGQNWIEVVGKNARINQLLRTALLDFDYKNYLYKNARMNTIDEFDFSYAALRQEVIVRKRNERILFDSENHSVVQEVSRKQALNEFSSHADLTYNTSVITIDGQQFDRVRTISNLERVSFGQAVGVTFLGGILLIAAVLTEGE